MRQARSIPALSAIETFARFTFVRVNDMNSVWIVDDDRSIRWVLEKALAREEIPYKSFGTAAEVLAALGSIDYWFVTEGRRVHKTVHHYLMRFLGGELSDDDVEVTEVAWVPLRELPSRLAYADERKLAEVAGELIDKLHTDGPGALPPLPRTAPRRRPQTHSRTRNHRTDDSAHTQPGRRANGCGPGT